VLNLKRKENKMFSLEKEILTEVAVKYGSEFVSNDLSGVAEMVNNWAVLPKSEQVKYLSRREGFIL